MYEGAPLRMEKKIDYMERKKSSRKANKDVRRFSSVSLSVLSLNHIDNQMRPALHESFITEYKL